MPKIEFIPWKKTLTVSEGTSVYDAACQASLPIASSCSGKFTCGKCNVQVLEGSENLSPRTQPEEKLLEREKNPPTDRISCRTFIHGDCSVTTRYW